MARKLLGRALWVALSLVVIMIGSLPGQAGPQERSAVVPPEEYPIYDLIVIQKFLTSQTTLVLLHPLTATRLSPQDADPPSRDFFERQGLFGGSLATDLIDDFLFKTRRSSRLEGLFGFGVQYRFVRERDVRESEVSLAPVPATMYSASPQLGPLPTIGVLQLSRVAFNRRENQALVYVGVDRFDGTGAGFLVLLYREGLVWSIVDTEVIWTAQPNVDVHPRERK